MKNFSECKDEIHSCSKCGLCQSVCPIYKITGNDCTVSRGHFVMLKGLMNGDLKMSSKINKYLDLCLKCGACSKFCPSGIDVVDIVALAKSEYFKQHRFEKFVSFIQKHIIFGFVMRIFAFFQKKITSKKYDKKVLYFGGCGSKINKNLNKSVVRILNSCGIEVLTPDFDCCGIPFFVRGDMDSFKFYMESFLKKVKEFGVDEIVTTCASCEKTLNSYKKWGDYFDFEVKNIFEYIKENNLKLELKKNQKVTFHKPCNINNFESIRYILENTIGLEYCEAEEYDKCCGFNGISKIKELKIMKKLFNEKRNSILKTNAKLVLTSCLGCEAALNLLSFGKYKVEDLTEFLGQNIK